MGKDGILYLDTLLRYYLHVNPDTMEDERWAHTLKYLLEIRKLEAKQHDERR